jgi:hypothetical protein
MKKKKLIKFRAKKVKDVRKSETLQKIGAGRLGWHWKTVFIICFFVFFGGVVWPTLCTVFGILPFVVLCLSTYMCIVA